MEPRVKKNTLPHVGIIKFSVFIYRMMPDGSLEPQPIDCTDLFKEFDMAKQAQIGVQGFDKWDCVKKVKETLERLK